MTNDYKAMKKCDLTWKFALQVDEDVNSSREVTRTDSIVTQGWRYVHKFVWYTYEAKTAILDVYIL